jgi:predicted PurR-regulated permease PerM
MVAAIFTIFILTFYLLLDEKNVKNFISNILPSEYQEQIIAVINKIAVKVGSWFRGQVFLGLIIFVIDYIGLTILHVPYALILAIIAGLLELIPTVGPFIAGLIAAFVALTISPWLALLVICLFLAVQFVENIIIVPKVMQKAVGISPVVILIALLIGGKLMGVIGAILAIPLAASLSVVILEWPTISKLFAKK